MHELSVCQALLRQVEALRLEHDALRVLRIEVQVGPLSGVAPELLESAYPIAAFGTPAQDADLVLQCGTVRVLCASCREEHEVPPNRMLCPTCGTWKTRLTAGDELLLARVELEPRKETCDV
ncbi:MAG: hydrogenase maturation nickel metallochaperone HypA [Myxococcota bacterium]